MLNFRVQTSSSDCWELICSYFLSCCVCPLWPPSEDPHHLLPLNLLCTSFEPSFFFYLPLTPLNLLFISFEPPLSVLFGWRADDSPVFRRCRVKSLSWLHCSRSLPGSPVLRPSVQARSDGPQGGRRWGGSGGAGGTEEVWGGGGALEESQAGLGEELGPEQSDVRPPVQTAAHR